MTKISQPTSERPTLEEWRKLYEAAASFRAFAPWNWMDDSMLFGVQNPEDGEIGYCCILGAGGSLFGMNLYPGNTGLDSYLRLASGEMDATAEDAIFSQICTAFSFGGREFLRKEDHEVIKSLGLTFSGRNAVPVFRDHTPGTIPWFINGYQARFFALALEQAEIVAQETRDDPGAWERRSPDRVPVRMLVAGNEGTSWKNAEVQIPIFPPAPAPDEPFPLDAVRDLRAHKLLKEIAVEVDVGYMDFPVQDAPGRRPYFPRTVGCIEAQSEFLLGFHLFPEESSITDMRMYLVEILTHAKMLPGTFLVAREETHQTLAPIASALGIEIKFVKRLKATAKFHRERNKFMKQMKGPKPF